MKDYLKGVLCGIGGVIPGLSGSVLLVIFGLYEKTITAIGTFFKDIKGNIKFLVPLVLGFATGIVLFSKVIDTALEKAEVLTRCCFLGLILGTLPTFYREVAKYGFDRKYYLNTLVAIIVGICLFYLDGGISLGSLAGSLAGSFIIGCIVALASIVPGLDSASTLSALGLYEAYISALASLDLTVLIPAGVGLLASALILSYIMHKLLARWYTATFATIFGLFIVMAPKVLSVEHLAAFGADLTTLSYIAIAILGFMVSYYFGDIKGHNAKIRALIKRRKNKS